MPKNKQTWDNSKQLVANVEWSKNNHENALLNTGVPPEENDWVRPGIPVRWTTDSSFKKKANQTIITYSFMTTKSKLNYGDDRREIIKPYANFTKTQQKDIAKLFKQIRAIQALNLKRLKTKVPSELFDLDSTQLLTKQEIFSQVFMPQEILPTPTPSAEMSGLIRTLSKIILVLDWSKILEVQLHLV